MGNSMCQPLDSEGHHLVLTTSPVLVSSSPASLGLLGFFVFWSVRRMYVLISAHSWCPAIHTLNCLIIAFGASVMYHLRQPDVPNRLTGARKTKAPSCRRVERYRVAAEFPLLLPLVSAKKLS